mgnify:CR=1 FL=1
MTKFSKKSEYTAEEIYEMYEGLEHDSLWLTDVVSLPDNLDLSGKRLMLQGAPIKQLPKNMKVGSLDVSYTALTSLPDDLQVEETLNMRETRITAIPDNLSHLYNLLADNSRLSKLPEYLTIDNVADFEDTRLYRIPHNLIVRKKLNLTHTRVSELPDNFKTHTLVLRYTPIKKLPKNLTVEYYLDIRNTSITEADLPDDLYVGQYLNMKGGEKETEFWRGGKYSQK